MLEEDIIDELMELPGVGEKTAIVLREAGYDSFEKIASASVDNIASLPGIGKRTAERIIEAAVEDLASLEENETEEIPDE